MQEKIYVCTKYNNNSIDGLLLDLSDVSSIKWGTRSGPVDYIPRDSSCFLFIETDGFGCYVLIHGSYKHGAKLVTTNEFKRIAAELCPPVTP